MNVPRPSFALAGSSLRVVAGALLWGLIEFFALLRARLARR